MLYDNSTLGQLTAVVEASLAGRPQALPDERDAWVADSEMADDLRRPAGAVVDWTGPGEGRVFLTGATGFVGAFMLADLLRMACVSRVGCLVRARDAAAGLERLRAAMAKYGLWEAFAGRLEDEHLGIAPGRFEAAARWASVVFHLGARVNHTQPYSRHRAVNTLGTRTVARFTCAGRAKALHYVLSISCFGPTGFATGATVVREDEPLLPHLAALPYDHGYAQSQWVADQLVRLLMD